MGAMDVVPRSANFCCQAPHCLAMETMHYEVSQLTSEYTFCSIRGNQLQSNHGAVFIVTECFINASVVMPGSRQSLGLVDFTRL